MVKTEISTENESETGTLSSCPSKEREGPGMRLPAGQSSDLCISLFLHNLRAHGRISRTLYYVCKRALYYVCKLLAHVRCS